MQDPKGGNLRPKWTKNRCRRPRVKRAVLEEGHFSLPPPGQRSVRSPCSWVCGTALAALTTQKFSFHYFQHSEMCLSVHFVGTACIGGENFPPRSVVAGGQEGQLPLPLNCSPSEDFLLVGKFSFKSTKFGAASPTFGGNLGAEL